MATAMRLAGNEEGKDKGSKGNGNGNVRVVGKEEGKGSKAMALVTRMAGKWTVMQQESNGDGNKGGRGAMATATKRAMAMATRVGGHKEGNGNGGKSGVDGNKGGG
jgi:hypothetical protein